MKALARARRIPWMIAAHYRVLRAVDDTRRPRAVAVALRLTWAAVRS